MIIPPFIQSVTPIVCHSEDADILNPPFNSRVRFQLEETMTLQDPEHERFAVQVTMASIPYSFYDIDESNNEIYLRTIALGDVVPTLQTLVIPPGNYAATKLAETVELLSNVAFGFATSGTNKNFEVLYIRSSNKMTLVSRLGILFSVDMQPPKACRRPMGFGRGEFGPATEITSDQMVYMQGSHQYLHMMSDMVAFHGYSGNFRYRTNLLQSMRVASPPFSIITFENRDLMMHNPVATTSISSFEILIQDVDGNPVNFRSMHWSVELAVMVVVKSQIVGKEDGRLNRDARYSSYLHSIRVPMQPDGEVWSETDETDERAVRPETTGTPGDALTEADADEEGERVYADRESTELPGDDAGDGVAGLDSAVEFNPLQFVDARMQGGDAEALRFSMT